MKKSLEGKIAIVTGASAACGIGRAASVKLAELGATVVVTDVETTVPHGDGSVSTLALIEATVADIKAFGGQAICEALDVASQSSVDHGIQHVLENLGSVDILVNNAGTTVGSGPFLSTTMEQWQESVNVNLLGPVRLSQAVIPHMIRAGGGSIVNVGSLASIGAEAGFGVYSATKHALVGLTKTVAAEFGHVGIRCNVVCPGYVRTDMHLAVNARIAAETGKPIEDVQRDRYNGVAMERAGEPEEVADLIAFLASPSSSYVTGVSVPISGGTPAGL